MYSVTSSWHIFSRIRTKRITGGTDWKFATRHKAITSLPCNHVTTNTVRSSSSYGIS